MERKRKKNLKRIVLISIPILSLFILLASIKHPKLDIIISIVLLISILISLINIYCITKKENEMIKEMINYFNSATDSKVKELKIENTEENKENTEENTIKYFTGHKWEEISRDKWKMIENIEEVKEIYNCLQIGAIAVIYKNNTKILYKNLGENNFCKLKDYLIKDILSAKPELKSKENELMEEDEEFLLKLSFEIFEEKKLKSKENEKEKMKNYLEVEKDYK